MKICIQNRATRKFLQADQTWIESATQARAFPTSLAAFRHCLEQQLADVNIVVEFGQDRHPLVIPVDSRPTPEQPASAM